MMGAQVSPEANAAMALLTLLSDPKQAKARIEEYNKAKAEHEAALAAAQKAQADFAAFHGQLSAEHSQREAELTMKEASLDRDQRKLAEDRATHEKEADARLATLAKREAELRDQAIKNVEWSTALNQLAANSEAFQEGLVEREKTIAAREGYLEKQLTEATKLKASHEAKLEALRRIVIEPAS